ncbi:AI-2E family transporter [Taklimakanibacter deserti]|uniref:AI-2E family transporter n=1 Tax=Taklimakanibacter deserti TaxID=2267839 RepID=UPI000E655E55
MSADAPASLSFWAERTVGLLAIGIIVFGCFWIARPLLGVIVWGALIAITLAPLHRMIARALGNRPKWAAALLVLVLLALLVVPLSLLPGSIERAIDGISRITNNWTELNLPPPPAWVGDLPLFGPKISEKWAALSSNSQALLTNVKPFVGPAFQWLAAEGASLGLSVLQILISIILAGIFLVSESGTTAAFERIAHRLAGVSGQNLLKLAVRTVRNVAQGVIGTALIQGALSGIGFAIAGIPLALALGVLSFGTSMLQIGTWLVWIPAALWLSYQGESGWALFTAVLGIIINVLDNVIKPLLIGRGADVPLWIIFIGVIGGILTIGFVGIFIGPIAMAAGYTILTSWLSEEAQRYGYDGR